MSDDRTMMPPIFPTSAGEDPVATIWAYLDTRDDRIRAEERERERERLSGIMEAMSKTSDGEQPTFWASVAAWLRAGGEQP